MSYTQYTQAQLVAAISLALEDPQNLYWKVDEIQRAINEGLLYWGALTSYWRERGSFQTIPNLPYYDLSLALPALRARTTTLGALVTEIQYHLQEPPGGIAGTGMTSQFSISQITDALTRARNQFVLDALLPFTINDQNPAIWSQVTQTWESVPVNWNQLIATNAGTISPPPSGRTDLDPSVVALGHVSWIDGPTGIVTPLRREDEWSEDSFNPIWTLEPGIPFAYSQAETRPTEIELFPAPLASGALELIYVVSIIMPIAANSLFMIPDEFASVIKWGALYSILSSQNEGYDPLRAKYAKERYDQCVTASQLRRSTARVQINNVPIPLDTLENLDAKHSTWRTTRGQPTFGGTIYDIIALAKVPNAAYGVTCDVVRSAPLPARSSDFIQLGPEEMPYLIDYCRHILSFKLGGSEFAATFPLFDNFLAGAASRNKLLAAQARYLTPLFAQAAIQESISSAA